MKVWKKSWSDDLVIKLKLSCGGLVFTYSAEFVITITLFDVDWLESLLMGYFVWGINHLRSISTHVNC